MVLYARQDVSYVLVPVGNGGCGQPHSRPVANGKPAKDFPLRCQACENFLRADIARSGGNKKVRTINGDTGLALKERYLGLWGATPETVPESPDDELAREYNEQKNITKNAASQTEAMTQIGAAVAGNTALMAKFIELLAQANGAGEPIGPVPVDRPELSEPRKWEYPVGGIPGVVVPDIAKTDPNADERTCLDCDTVIVRKEGQRGALPQRCAEHKAAHQARQRAARVKVG